MKTRGFGRLAALGLCGLLFGCADRDERAGAEPAVLAAEFETGFRSAMGDGDRGVDAGAAPAEISLLYDRSSRLGGRIETLFAENLSTNIAFPPALPDPARFVTGGEARTLYLRELTARGLPLDSSAGATALLFGVAWEIINDRRLSPQDNAAILRQADASLRRNGGLGRDDAARQTEAEARLLTAAVWLREAGLHRSDKDAMGAFSDAVRRDMLEKTGSDLRRQRITRDGFVAD